MTSTTNMFPLLQLGGMPLSLDPIALVLMGVIGAVEAVVGLLGWALLGHAVVAAVLLPWIATRSLMTAKARAWWCLFVLLAPVSGAVVWLAHREHAPAPPPR
ncbi:MAG TPA: hypothetical protein VD997_09015 [Phycisphaerales bacterium]|nr:hypothetical protein [Phycisphaerales bacterium]